MEMNDDFYKLAGILDKRTETKFGKQLEPESWILFTKLWPHAQRDREKCARLFTVAVWMCDPRIFSYNWNIKYLQDTTYFTNKQSPMHVCNLKSRDGELCDGFKRSYMDFINRRRR